MKRFLNILVLVSVLFCGVASAKPKIKAILITGQNNHKWELTSPVLEKVLRDSGIFDVDVAKSPAQGQDMSGYDPQFKNYDVIILDYNGDRWSEATSNAFLDYVRNGGGIVIIHAANNGWGKWKEYNEMIGIGGWGGRNPESGPYWFWEPVAGSEDGKLVSDPEPLDGPTGSHEGYSPLIMDNRNKKHPIMKGLPDQWHHEDELYNFMRGPGNVDGRMEILATCYSGKYDGTKRHEPLLFTMKYGKGRVFHSQLGHDDAVFQKGFQVPFARGAEWAATGDVTQTVPRDFPAVLTPAQKLKNYKPTDDAIVLQKAFTEVGQCDAAKAAEYEDMFIKYLEDPETEIYALQAICDTLRIIATKKSVPVLEKLLVKDIQTSNAVRLTLETIPGKEANDALINALAKSSGMMQAGIINSLGVRAEADSLSALKPLAMSSDKVVADTAIAAIGSIGTADALKVLESIKGNEAAVDSAILNCAFKIADSGDNSKAFKVFAGIYNNNNSTMAYKTAALGGMLVTDSATAMKTVWKMLESDDQSEVGAALSMLGSISSSDGLALSIVKRIEAMSETTQIKLLGVLGSLKDGDANKTVAKMATKGKTEDVRLAAIGTLGRLPGDKKTVTLLAKLSADSKGATQKAARDSLVSTFGPEAEKEIPKGLNNRNEKIQLEYIRAAGNREFAKSANQLLTLAKTADEKVRGDSLVALRKFAGANEYYQLIDIAVNEKVKAVKEKAVRAVIRAGRKVDDNEKKTDAYLEAIAQGDEATKLVLLKSSYYIGGAKALAAVKTYAESGSEKVRNEAIRALSNWKETAAVDVVLELAAATDNKVHRILLMRAFGRLMAMSSDQDPVQKLVQCEKALNIGLEVEPKRMLINIIAEVGDERALVLIEKIGQDAAVKADADKAAGELRKSLMAAPVLDASRNAGQVSKAIDGDANSRWDTGRGQKPGDWFLIDMNLKLNLNSVTLDTTNSKDDYPHGYEVYLSDDGKNFGDKPVLVDDKGNGPVTVIKFAEGTKSRYIKIVSLGDIGNFWSIHELKVDFDLDTPKD